MVFFQFVSLISSGYGPSTFPLRMLSYILYIWNIMLWYFEQQCKIISLLFNRRWLKQICLKKQSWPCILFSRTGNEGECRTRFSLRSFIFYVLRIGFPSHWAINYKFGMLMICFFNDMVVIAMSNKVRIMWYFTSNNILSNLVKAINNWV